MSKLNPNVAEFIPSSSQVLGNNTFVTPFYGYNVGYYAPGLRIYELHRGIDSVPLVLMSNQEVSKKTNKATGKETTVHFTRYTFQKISSFLCLFDSKILSRLSFLSVTKRL